MDVKWIIKREIKQEEPVDYYLVSSSLDGELNEAVDTYANDEQSADIPLVEVKQEHSGQIKRNDDELDEYTEFISKESDKEYVPEYGDNEEDDAGGGEEWINRKRKNSLQKPRHKFHKVFTVDDVPTFACNICSLTFPEKKILRAHRSIHKGKPFQCDICKKVYPTRSHILSHMKVHREPQFCCPICDKRFALQKSFTSHQSVHEEKKFKCLTCSKLFRQKVHLADHMKTHGERTKRFKCEICDAAYYAQRTLTRHMKAAHSISYLLQRNRYRCPNALCDKSYLQISSFRSHSCDNGRRLKSALSANCPTCNKCFFNQKEKNRHIERVHARKPDVLRCMECSKTFRRHLYDRFVQHVAQKCAKKILHECDYCTRLLPSKSKLFQHFVEAHKFAVDGTIV